MGERKKKETKDQGESAEKGNTYSDGPRIGNGIDHLPACHRQTYGDLEKMKAKCDADPKCFVLHDWACDGKNWRYCSDTLENLQSTKAGKADKKACTKVKDKASGDKEVKKSSKV